MTSERSSENELLKYALKYADWGLRVFPVHSVREGACTCLKEHCHSVGKHPRTKNGVKDATLVGNVAKREYWHSDGSP